jgi:hypothetical protein
MTGVRHEDRLQKYFDGELSAEEREAMRLELEASGDLAAKLRGLEHLQKLVREHATAELEVEAPSNDEMWAAIQGKIDQGIADDEPMFPQPVRPEQTRPALQVIPGGKPGDKSATDKRVEEKRRPRTMVWLGVAGTIAAAAAALLLFVLPNINPPGIDAPPGGSEVEEVDFGYSTGAIFSVEGQEGARYAVVWISDEKPLIDEAEGTP